MYIEIGIVYRNLNGTFVKSKLQLSRLAGYSLECNSTLSFANSELECSLSLIGVVDLLNRGKIRFILSVASGCAIRMKTLKIRENI